MDLLKGLIFLLSFYICLSTASVLSGIEELAEFEEEDVDKRRRYVQQIADQIPQVEFAALEGKVSSYGIPQMYNHFPMKRQKVEDSNADIAYITGENHVELGGDPSEIQEAIEANFPNGAELLDKKDINMNSALAKMLETMAVVEDGKEKKESLLNVASNNITLTILSSRTRSWSQPAGLHPDTDRKVQEESVERQGTAETLFVVDPPELHPDTDRKIQQELSVDTNKTAKTPLIINPAKLNPKKNRKVNKGSPNRNKIGKLPFRALVFDKNGPHTGNKTRRGFKRNLSVVLYAHWPGGVVPYTIDTKFSAHSVYNIKATIGELQERTCIRFIDAKSDETLALSHNSIVHFVNGPYCKSRIGRIRSEQQEIMLKESTCMSRATIIHEILHTLGFFHEQARSDRDKYITMHKDRIRPDQLNNFESRHTINSVPYDAESVLQYSLYSFGKTVNGKVQKTMELKDPKLEFLSDMSFGLDMYDIAEINKAYKCADHCKVVPKCKNGGYVNHKCKCDCPSPLKGKTCEEVKTDAGCGGIVDVSRTTTKTIESPNFPNKYPYGKKCIWLIRAPKYEAVKITINELSLPHNANSVCYHWLEIRYNLLGQLGPKRCGTFKGQSWVTNPNKDDNRMILIFDAYFGRARTASTGFQITATSVYRGCETHGCEFGSCVKESSGESRCQCATGITGSHCDYITKTGSLSCNFESGSECFLKNDISNGDLFWIGHTGGTPSRYTGPTNAQEGSRYLYFESSTAAKQGDTAMLTSRDDIVFSDDTLRCLTFHYSMYGRTMGTLNIYQRGSNGVKRLIFTKSGGQGRDWKYGEVTVTPMAGLRISFEAVRGKSFTGDIAIDDVQLKPGKCLNTPATCTFEPDDYCYWETAKRNTKFPLKIIKGKTRSTCTGPSAAYEGQYYIHLEATDYRRVRWRKNYMDYLIPAQEVDYPHCLSFVYHKLDRKPHMYQYYHKGFYNMGKLKIRARPNPGFSDVGTVLFDTGFGSEGDKWHPQNVTIPGRTRQLEIVLKKGISYCGDVSVDDIKLSLHAC